MFSFCLSICLSVYLSNYLSICLHVCLYLFRFHFFPLLFLSMHVSLPHSALDQALLVANQYVVSFDGLLFQLPAWSCPVVLAQDRSQNPTFTLLLSPRRQSHHGLLLDMNHSTLNIYPDGQVWFTRLFSV